jgi:hypothetical protein
LVVVSSILVVMFYALFALDALVTVSPLAVIRAVGGRSYYYWRSLLACREHETRRRHGKDRKGS